MEEQNTTQDILNQVHESTPDSLHPVLDYIIKNGKLIAAGIAAIILIAGGAAGFKYMNQQQLITAQSEMGSILIKYSGEEQVKALADFEKDAPSSMKPAVQLALAKSLMEISRFADAKAAWAAVGKSSPEMAPVAGLGEAKCLILDNKAAEALPILEALKNSAGEEFAATIGRVQAEAAEQAGKFQLAIDAYQGLLASSPQEAPYFKIKINELKAKL
ncbi:tetratricopeptide repeat protein [Maridesulfovibrio sp.]|uniref:tetratricopeptide repeat protein n=1 Tax=Maridesulfovibrio sp. TaxID=2795000 RepID=UPI0029F57CC8|nr:tetratricopeptide repeat protein [Maridesulfovibrio sp.]